MKLRTWIASCILLILVAACQKEITSEDNAGGGGTENPPATDGKLVRIQQGVDPNLDNDTIWTVGYNGAGNISFISDSIYQDTLRATYDAAGRVTKIADGYGTTRSLTYDANGLLTEYLWDDGSTKEKDVYTYTNGVVSKRSHYTNAGSGNLFLWRDYVYTVTNGNITTIKEYAPNGTQTGTQTYEYGTEANQFKGLCFFPLGTSFFIDEETYFNKNLLKKAVINTSMTGTFTNTYTMDSKKRIIKTVQTDDTGRTWTWMFEYK